MATAAEGDLRVSRFSDRRTQAVTRTPFRGPYVRLGEPFPAALMWFVVCLSPVAPLLGVAGTALYFDMSGGHFLVLWALAALGFLAEGVAVVASDLDARAQG